MLRGPFFALILLCIFFAGCDSKTKEDLLQEGIQFSGQGNYRGAIVLFKNALEKDPNFIDARLQLGDAYLESGKFQNAENEFQKVLLQDPANKDILLKLARVYLNTQKPDQAIEIIEKGFSSSPENAKALELLGRAYAIKGDLKTAEQTFRQGLSVDPENSAVKLSLARVLFGQQRTEEARSLLNEVISGDSKNVGAYFFLAELESSAGHVDQALTLYEKLIQLNSGDVTAHFRAGMLWLAKGDVAKAREQAAAISAIAPDRPEGLRLKGLVSYVEGDYTAASLELMNSLKIQPHINSYFFLGLSYYALEQYEQALSQFQKTLDLNPDFVKARNLTAMTLLKQERLDDAITACRKALEIEPGNAFTHHILGSAYLKKGMLDEGMEELDQATLLNPDLVGAFLQKGLVRISQGDVELGEENLVQALNVAPEIQNTRLLLVSYYLRQQNYAAAITTVNEGLTGEPVDGLFYNLLAGAYFAQGKTAEALNALEKGKSVNPDYFTPYYNLAAYQTSKGDYELARGEYQSVLQRDPQQTKALLSLAALSSLLGEQDQIPQYLDRARATGSEEAYLLSAKYFAKQGKSDQALQTVQEGLSLHPEAALLLELKGKLLSSKGDSKNAETAFIDLSKLEPERGAALLVSHYLKSGTAEQAVVVAKKLIDSAPVATTGYLLLSGIQVRQKDIPSALQTLEKGMALVKDKQRLEMQIGVLYEKTGDDNKAAAVYKKVAEGSPDYVPALYAQASLKHRQGDMRQAQDLYRQVLQLSPEYVPALNNLAYMLTDNFGRSQEALDLALKAYRQGSSDPFIMDTLGYVLVANGRSQEALGVLQEAVRLVPDNPTINLHLGMAYSQLDENEKAQPYLQMVSEKGQPDEIKQANELLLKK